jgi:hypothetical protein
MQRWAEPNKTLACSARCPVKVLMAGFSIKFTPMVRITSLSFRDSEYNEKITYTSIALVNVQLKDGRVNRGISQMLLV